jgi:hypothetical protein
MLLFVVVLGYIAAAAWFPAWDRPLNYVALLVVCVLAVGFSAFACKYERLDNPTGLDHLRQMALLYVTVGIEIVLSLQGPRHTGNMQVELVTSAPVGLVWTWVVLMAAAGNAIALYLRRGMKVAT